MTRIVAIIQARMTSTRLPGKVLQDIAGRPMLAWTVERARRAATLDDVVVATTIDPSDDPLEAYCREQGYPCARGSLNDVLDRYYQAAKQFRADVIVRLTSDCPLIDPDVIDTTVLRFRESGVDFAANRLPPPWRRTYPIGLDTEVCTFAALERAWAEAGEKYEREHVMPYLYDQPGRFRTLLVNTEPDYGHLRWTVDTPQDLEAIRGIVSALGNRNDFTWLDVLEITRRHPELGAINAGIHHKSLTE